MQPVQWSLWLWWGITTSAATAVFGAILFSMNCVNIIFGTLLGLAMVFPIGYLLARLQWVLLRSYLPRHHAHEDTAWIRASTCGWGVGVVAGFFVMLNSMVPLERLLQSVEYRAAGLLFALVFGVVTGVVLGASQWLALRRYLKNAGWWVLTSTISSVLAITVTVITDVYGVAGRALNGEIVTCSNLNQWGSWAGIGVAAPIGIRFGALYGTVFGILSGIVLGWLLQRPHISTNE